MASCCVVPSSKLNSCIIRDAEIEEIPEYIHNFHIKFETASGAREKIVQLEEKGFAGA